MPALMKLPAPTPAQVLNELEREQRMRARVYPGLVANRSLKQHELEHRHACLEKAISDLRELYADAEDGR